jgi:Lon protease-like protein
VAELHDLGLFPLGLVLVPGEQVPLHLFEPRYRQLLADCVLDDQPFVVVLASEGGAARVGCTARFDGLLRRFVDGRLNVTVTGVRPVEIVEETNGRLYFSAVVRELEDAPATPDPELVAEAVGLYRRLAEKLTGAARDPEVPEGVALSYALAATIELAPPAKQSLLESRDEAERLAELVRVLRLAEQGVERAAMAAERAQRNGRVSAP